MPTFLKSATNRFLKTLQLIPDFMVLDMASREFDLEDPESCVCGWAIREAIANGVPQEKVNVDLEIYGPNNWNWMNDNQKYGEFLAKYYGGTTKQWLNIFYGAVGADHEDVIVPDHQLIHALETAFTLRVMEAIESYKFKFIKEPVDV